MEEKLHRIQSNDTVLGGVCLGLGEKLGVDPVIFRVSFVILFFTPVPAFIIYAIMWIALPQKIGYAEVTFANDSNQELYNSKSNFSNFKDMSRNSKQGNVVGGIILVVIGSIFAFRTFFDINLFHYIGKMWPLFLIGLGVWLILRDRIDDNSYDDNFNTPTKTGGNEQSNSFDS